MTPPDATPRLVNLAPAVSTEAVRWMFRRWGIGLDESLHVPVIHIFALARYGTVNDRRPLVALGNRRFRTEPEIAAHFDPLADPSRRLLPTGDRLSSEYREITHQTVYAHRVFRPRVVRFMYRNLLKDRALAWNSFTLDAPWYESALAVPLWNVIVWAMTSNLGLSDESAETAEALLQRDFDRIAARLADGRPYLCGDRFTIADLTFAASAAPLILAKGYGGHLPKIEALPDALQRKIEGFRAHPAGSFVKRIYHEERNPVAPA